MFQAFKEFAQSADSVALSRNPQKARQSADWLGFLGQLAVLELLLSRNYLLICRSTAFE